MNFSSWVKILLPLAIAAAIGLSPRPAELERALSSTGGETPDEKRLQTLLEHEPWRIDTLESLALARRQAGDTEGVIHLLSQAGAEGMLTAQGLALLASACEEAGLRNQALETRIQLLRLEPQERGHYLAVSRMEMDMGLFDGAEHTLNLMLDEFPDDAEGLYRLGLVVFALGDPQGVEHVRQAVKLAPKFDKKLKILLAAESRASRSGSEAHRLLSRGRGLAAAGEWPMAGRLFEQAVAADPAYAEGWAYLGEARQQTGTGDGQAELQKAAGLDENSQAVRGLTALYHRRRGEYGLALEWIAAAAAAEPELASWQIEWANTLAEKGDLDEAADRYRAALELEPPNLDNLYLFGLFCLTYDMGLREAGLPAAREGAARAPGDPRWQDLLGRIFWAMGDADLAERAYRQALEIEPGHPAASLHFGQFHLERGEEEKAYGYLKASALQETDGAVSEMAVRMLERFYHEEVRPIP